MREIVTAVEMKELDHNTIQKAGISSPVLMERAALKTVEEIVQRLKNKEKEKVLFENSLGRHGSHSSILVCGRIQAFRSAYIQGDVSEGVLCGIPHG